jgi:hypothetical protein
MNSFTCIKFVYFKSMLFANHFRTGYPKNVVVPKFLRRNTLSLSLSLPDIYIYIYYIYIYIYILQDEWSWYYTTLHLRFRRLN